MSDAARQLAVLFREQHGRLLALLLREAGLARLAAAEDALQQAMLAALRRWPFDGVPERPAAWLFEVARRALIDEHRGNARRETGHELDLLPDPRSLDAAPVERFARELDGDELALLFAVCHPDLPAASQVALALRTLGGFGLRELAAGLLTTEAALAQRLKRARDALGTLGDAALAVPPPQELPARRDAVLTALYLMFNEGYQSAAGSDYARRELCFEAIRLTRALAAHPVAGAPQAHALAATLCLHAARLSGRTDADGRPLLLPQQPRDRWDAGLVAMGMHHLDRSRSGDTLTRWHCEAAIAAAHASAPRYADTDWRAIVEWYSRLIILDPSPVPRLAQAIAIGEAQGAAEGLAAVEAVLPLLPRERYPFGHTARGDFLARLGRIDAAREAYAQAMAQTRSAAERQVLERKIAALGSTDTARQ